MCRSFYFFNPGKRIMPVLFFIIIAAGSCNRHGGKADHYAAMRKITDSAGYLADKQELAKAIRYFDTHYALIDEPGTGDEWKKYYFKQNAYYLHALLNNNNKKNLELASAYADSMLMLMKDRPAKEAYPDELRTTYFAKGDVLFAMGYFPDAFRFYYQGKLVADQSGNKCYHALFDSRFALLNYKEAKFKEAASLFLQAYRDDLSCNLDFETFAATQGAMDNAGLSYEHLGMADSAENCYRTAIAYIKRNAPRFPDRARFVTDAYGVTYGYLGMMHQDRGNMDEAETWFKKSIMLNSYAGNEKHNAQLIQLKLARVYMETGRMRQTDSLINAVRVSLDTLPNNRAEPEWQKIKWNYLYAIKQPQKANPYLLEYLQLKDRADAGERKMAVANAGSSFQRIQQDYELAILKKENELRTLSLVVTLGFSVMAIFIIFQVWRNWRSSKKNNETLSLLNNQITEQNNQMRKTLNSLEQSQEDNTRMMQIVAHDLRNPIGGITSIAALMLEDEGRSGDDVMMLELIKTSGQNSLEMVSDLLQVHTRAEALKKEPVDLSVMLHYCVDLLHFKAEAKKQQINLQIDTVVLMVNREKMWRVISNLIANAIKFSPTGATINVVLKIDAGHVLIEVEDFGIGVPEEMKDKVFDMYTEAKRPGTAGEQPFGLGLAISKQIVEAHNGRIWFVSKPGNGTTFFVQLPVLAS
ncbi:MAG: hypothetical protein JWR09_2233 [Mucilaginibacter sp.]|nr:hypothetical protein [Mucilaginibacter sp.]